MSSTIVNTNVMSLSAQYALQTKSKGLSQSLERLSSGLRINTARDDAAGLVIANRMTAAMKGSQQSWRNANDGISIAQTAEGSLSTIGNDLQRMRELAVQSANDTNTALDRVTLDNEFQQLIRAIGRVADTTQFNQQALLDGSRTEQVFQIGAQQGERLITGKLDARNTQLGAREIIGADGVTHTQIERGLEQISGRFTIHIDRVNGQEISPMQLHIDLSDPRINPDFNPATGNTGLRNFDDLNRVINRAIANTIQGTHPPGSFTFDASQMSAEEARHKLARVNLNAATVTKNDDKNTVALTGAFDARFRLTMDDPLEVVVTRDREIGVASIGSIGLGGSAANTVNMMLMIDRSGSMSGTPFANAKAAAIQAIDAYENAGVNLNVRLIEFPGSGANPLTDYGWNNNLNVVRNSITAMTLDGGENFNTFFPAVESIFNANPPSAGSNVSYLLTDAAYPINSTVKTNWINFVETKEIISYVIGIGTGANTSYLDEIAHNGVTQTSMTAIPGSSADLANILASQVNDSFNYIELSKPAGITGLTPTFNDGIGQEITTLNINIGGERLSIDVSDVRDLTQLGERLQNNIRDLGSPFANVSVVLDASGSGFTIDNPDKLPITELRLNGPQRVSLFTHEDLSSEQVNLTQIDITTRESAMLALHVIDGALQQIADQRAVLGAVQNEFAKTLENLDIYQVNLSGARSRILDADFAAETAQLTRAQILQQASISVLSQANANPQSILSLLQ
ncbi:flagellin [Thiorhodospira sibirica]|uniref:flagellin N-terminal helical domain-containing protein n=1 Tax=Thiorhodospira sibirica TaxID=154347 RepID=UPI00022C058B